MAGWRKRAISTRFFWMAVLAAACASTGGRARADGLVPLAYLHRVELNVTSTVAPGTEPAKPKAPSAARRWQRGVADRLAARAVRTAAPEAAGKAIAAALGRLPGIMVPTPGAAPSADALLEVTLDDAGLRTGFERTVWLHTVAFLIRRSDGQRSGPFFVNGRASATRSFFGKGYRQTDNELLRSAADQLARGLCHTLDTGEQNPLARPCRVAIVPADIPDTAVRRSDGVSEPGALAIRGTQRLGDVLLQPEMGAAATLVPNDEVERALSRLGSEPGDFWTRDGNEQREMCRRMAGAVGADFLFLSRVAGVELRDKAHAAHDGPLDKPGIERTATTVAHAFLVNAAGEPLWSSRAEGSTAALTDYVRHAPRIRTEQQCVADATRTAYAILRINFEDFLRRYSR